MEGGRPDHVQVVGARDDFGRVRPRRQAAPVDQVEAAVEAVVGAQG